ncbi:MULTISPECIES: hypothetical protein [Halopenitus]|uniref:DUF7975 domain-containing protein n=1 Tax=Halopenitus malekzadehii TaxID=1267564 RepID=A0A1H6IVI8_9EURY|nr:MULTISPECIES: hypothetical protein [Halopenitus]SEH52116.1 hypothetical protein SAMN05192561_10498 [Halopenitus malekzadehii]
MTRFDAAEETERHALFADAVSAHRARSSPVATLDVDADSDTTTTEDDLPPWIQVAGTEVVLDVTDDELDRLKTLLDDYPEFRIDELHSPEDAEGTNAVITARSDANRIADFIERTFRTVFELDDDYRVWASEI